MRDPWLFLDLENKNLSDQERNDRILFKQNSNLAYRSGIIVSFSLIFTCVILNFLMPYHINVGHISQNDLFFRLLPFNERVVSGYSKTYFADQPYFSEKIYFYALSNIIVNFVMTTWIIWVLFISYTRPTFLKHKTSNFGFFSVYLFLIFCIFLVSITSPSYTSNIVSPSLDINPSYSAIKESVLLIGLYFVIGGISVDFVNRIRVSVADRAKY